MTHGAAEVDFDAGMNQKTMTLRLGQNHHVYPEWTCITRADNFAQSSRNLILNRAKVFIWHVTIYHLLLFFFRSNDITRIRPVVGIEEREPQILYPSIGKSLKLHAEILDLWIERLYHHRPLAGDDIAKPAAMVIREFTVNKANPSTTTAPRGLDHQARTLCQTLFYGFDCRNLNRRLPPQPP